MPCCHECHYVYSDRFAWCPECGSGEVVEFESLNPSKRKPMTVQDTDTIQAKIDAAREEGREEGRTSGIVWSCVAWIIITLVLFFGAQFS